MKIALVACVSRKRRGRYPAKDLYDSTLFRKASEFAKSKADRWFILSAKHHLLKPETVVKDYNLSLRMLSREKQKDWAKRVIESLLQNSTPSDDIIMLAGALYRRDLVPKLRQMGYKVEIPLEGKRIGKQLQWLGRN